MRVVVDIQAAIAQRAGVGRYVKALVEHLAPLAGRDELGLFYFDFTRRGTPFPVSGARERAVRWCPGRIVQAAWKKKDWPPFDWFSGKADVFHFPNFIRPPLKRGKSVVTVHDLAFMRHPDTIEPRNLEYLVAQIRGTVDRADRILAVSEFTAREIEELLGVPKEKIETIHEGIEMTYAPGMADATALRDRLGLDRPYLLMVGTLEPRKNIPFLVKMFEKLEDFDGYLVLAGMQGWTCDPILDRMRTSRRADRIKQLDFVPEPLLPALYAEAEVFVFPSLYEGFGFPPLEAMACGTPVLAAATASLPEVLGDAGLLLHGFDEEGWADSVRRLLTDSELRETFRKRGLEQVKKYSWKACAEKTWGLYRAMGGEGA